MKVQITKVNRSTYEVLRSSLLVVRKSSKLKEELTIGDYVEVENNTIIKLYPRTSVLTRASVKQNKSKQVMAANFDIIYICLSANQDFNMNKYYDYLSLAQTTKAEVRLLLTKIDLTEDVDQYISQIDIPVTPISIYDSLDNLKNEIKGKTVCFIGASGVGKSSVISLLSGAVIEVNDIRESDAQGRHTTTARTMYVCEDYKVMDLPGIRIVKTVNKQNDMIEEAALGCKFRNCKHITEPKCNVKHLVETGEIPERVYLDYIQK